MAYHDIGRIINEEEHEKESTKMFLKDEFMKKYFLEEEIQIISEAIEDHRASIKYEPRNSYGKLISSADRNISIQITFAKSYEVGKFRNPNQTVRKFLNSTFDRLRKKYSMENPENMFL